MFSVASFLDDTNGNALAVLQPTVTMLTDYAAAVVNHVPNSIIYDSESGLQYAGSNRQVVQTY